MALRDVVAAAMKKQTGTDRLLLVVDQFEEVYTLCRDGTARQRFIDQILEAAANGPLSVVLTLRGDFFHRALGYRALADRIQNAVVMLGPMSRGELTLAVKEPAKKVGLRFEPGLAERILDDVEAEPGNLPLLELVLADLWEGRKAGLLAHAAYEAAGKVEGVLACRAAEASARLSMAEREVLRRILVDLVRPGEEADTRKRAILVEMGHEARPIVDRWVAARLIVTGRDDATGRATIEIAHEALIAHWEPLRLWVCEDRELLARRDDLEAAAHSWEAMKRPNDGLLRGAQFAHFRGDDLVQERRARYLSFVGPGAQELLRVSAARRVPRWFAAAAGLVVVGAVSFASWWFGFHVHVIESASMIEVRGEPKPVSELSWNEVKHRSRHYRFEVRRGHVLRVELVNSHDEPQTMEEVNGADVVAWVPHYDSENHVIALKGLNRNGAALEIYEHTTGRTWYRDPSERFLKRRGSDVAGELLTTDAHGWVIERRYVNSVEAPRALPDGSYGIRYELDLQGLPIRETFLGADGRPKLTKRGEGARIQTRDNRGEELNVEVLDVEGRPALGTDLVYRKVRTRDRWGNIREETHFDREGKLAPDADGIVRLAYEYDPAGNVTAASSFDRSGALAPSRQGYATVSCRYDARGRVRERAYLDADGHSSPTKDGYASIQFGYDARGNVIAERYLGRDGNATSRGDGYHRVARSYDDSGYLTEEAYFDTAGARTLSKDGYAGYRARGDERRHELRWEAIGIDGKSMTYKGYQYLERRYDNYGNEIEVAFFDSQGGRTTQQDLGVSVLRYKYDEHGYTTEETNYDTHERLVAVLGVAVARARYAYDERGNRREQANFGPEGTPGPDKNGCTAIGFSYDQRGNVLETSCQNAERRLVNGKDGFARTVMRYDDRDNLSEMLYFDPDGNRVADAGELISRFVWRYDDRGNKIEERHYDVSDQPTFCKHGDMVERMTYDDRGNEIRLEKQDADGRAMAGIDGVATFKWRYDDQGNRRRSAAFDAEGKPTEMSSTETPVTVSTYDARGNSVEQCFLDSDEKPTLNVLGYSKGVTHYDEQGRVDEFTYFGIHDELVVTIHGPARATLAYDARGNVIDTRLFGIHGRPEAGDRGVARWTTKYDEAGHEVEKALFDANGAPTAGTLGYARFTEAYDAHGNVVEVAYYGPDGRRTKLSDGYAVVRTSYDERNNPLELTYYDEDLQPALNKSEKYSRKLCGYDAHNDLIAAVYFGPGGEPIASSEGAPIIHYAYDERHRCVEQRLLDAHGTPTVGKMGYSFFKDRYDTHDRPIERRFFDTRGNPVTIDFGCAITKKTYDARGNRIGLEYSDQEGNPVLSVDGYAREVSRYNTRGFLVETAYFGLRGEPVRATAGFARSVMMRDETGKEVGRTLYGPTGDLLKGERFVTIDYWQWMDLPKDARGTRRAIVVTAVRPGSAATRAGIQTGDVVLEYAGHQVRYDAEKRGKASGLDPLPAGRKAKVKLIRSERGESREFIVEIDGGALGFEVGDAGAVVR